MHLRLDKLKENFPPQENELWFNYLKRAKDSKYISIETFYNLIKLIGLDNALKPIQ